MEGAVAQDSGVTHHTVNGAELIQGGLDDVLGTLGLGDTVVVGDGAAAGLLDLVHDLICHRMPGARPVARATEVVDDDAGALLGQGQRVLATQSAAGTGDDDDSILNSGHDASSLQRVRRGYSPPCVMVASRVTA